MGARQRAQQRAKKNPGPPNTAGVYQRVSSSSLQVPSLDAASRAQALQGWQNFTDSPSVGSNGLSMAQTARNTDSHFRGWASTPYFRQNPIVFVSSGNLKLEDNKDEQDEVEREPEQELLGTLQPDVQESTAGEEPDNVQLLEKAFEERVGKLEISTENTDIGTPSTHPRRTSVSSVESDELILFAGRHGVANRTPRPPRTKSQMSDADVTEADKPAEVTRNNTKEGSAIATSTEADSASQANEKGRAQDILPLPSNGLHGVQKQFTPAVSDEEEAIMRDYIDNMKAHNDEDNEVDPPQETSESQPVSKQPARRNQHYRYHIGTPEEKVTVKSFKIPDNKARVRADAEIVWDSEDLKHFDELSTTDDDIDVISQVLRQRERASGLQYLVTGLGCAASDAKWLSAWKMTSESAREEIRIFEETRDIEVAEDLDDEDESTDSEEAEALNDLIGAINSEDDENARIMEVTGRMTDEQIARALAKQEELGLDTDEVLLLDGQVQADGFSRQDDFISFSTQTPISNRTRSKRAKRGKDSFPSAAAFADALDEDPYGAFDVMDFDRPSLKAKKKGRKADLPFELEEEDAEWAEKFSAVWSKDRDKKAARKREREELRNAGMLGARSRNGQVDLHAKYSNVVMDADQIRGEIRSFLVEEFESLSLGAMHASMRASVHRLAKALHLKSHSHGSGDNRHPILTKTPFTPYYSLDTIWEIDNLLNQRKFFPQFNGAYKTSRTAKSKTPGSGARERRGGGGGALSGATYMDGDEVAASVPAIAADNKGRAMLEKLGWTSGMGLGALGNEGRVDPIKHIVKTTKAGLG